MYKNVKDMCRFLHIPITYQWLIACSSSSHMYSDLSSNGRKINRNGMFQNSDGTRRLPQSQNLLTTSKYSGNAQTTYQILCDSWS